MKAGFVEHNSLGARGWKCELEKCVAGDGGDTRWKTVIVRTVQDALASTTGLVYQSVFGYRRPTK